MDRDFLGRDGTLSLNGRRSLFCVLPCGVLPTRVYWLVNDGVIFLAMFGYALLHRMLVERLYLGPIVLSDSTFDYDTYCRHSRLWSEALVVRSQCGTMLPSYNECRCFRVIGLESLLTVAHCLGEGLVDRLI